MSESIWNKIAETQEEQLRWIRLLGMSQLKSTFETAFNSDDEKLVYDLSDGKRSTRDIERLTNVGRTKIGVLWKKWYQMGIMEKSKKYEGGRMLKSFSLSDVGITVPTLPAQQQEPSTGGDEE